MIVDNADDGDVFFKPAANSDSKRRLAEYLPQCPNGSIIFTTRNKKTAIDLASPSDVIPVHAI